MATRKILVVPSCREDQMSQFVKAWDGYEDWDRMIVIQDAPEATFGTYSWADIDEELGRDAWIISRRDSAIRCFGFIKALQDGATHVLTLDDDCRPHYPSFDTGLFDSHINRMKPVARWISTVSDIRTRGLPYRNVGHCPVMASMGTWSGVPDQDAICALSDPVEDYSPETNADIAPFGMYFPMCGMNLCFKSEVASLFYFPLMGEGQPYRRFDDIWAGIIAKKVMDHLKFGFSVGEPFIRHARASDPFVNLVKEALGVVMNETFWEHIDRIPLSGYTPIDCVVEIGNALHRFIDPYMAKLGAALLVWARLMKPLMVNHEPGL